METCKPLWEESFYANNREIDLSPEMMQIDDDYHFMESKLISSYSPEQMEIYVSLESKREGFITELGKSMYQKGYTDALKDNGRD